MPKNAVSYVRGVIPSNDRERDDFYPTPPEGTRALLGVERFDPVTTDGAVWEPACGDGAMVRELAAAGYRVHATDLIDRGCGQGGVDFLLNYVTQADHFVTNPPFKLAEAFAAHARARVPGKVALLARLAWLEGKERRRLFARTGLSRVWVFSSRLHMQKARQAQKTDAGGMIAFAWFVWDPAHEGPTQLGWLP